MSAPRIHRVVANSKRGRQIASANRSHVEHREGTAEQREWNRQVEAKRLAKKAKCK